MAISWSTVSEVGGSWRVSVCGTNDNIRGRRGIEKKEEGGGLKEGGEEEEDGVEQDGEFDWEKGNPIILDVFG